MLSRLGQASLSGRVAVVTGAAMGIGSAIATKHQGSWKISHHDKGGALVEIALPRLL